MLLPLVGLSMATPIGAAGDIAAPVVESSIEARSDDPLEKRQDTVCWGFCGGTPYGGGGTVSLLPLIPAPSDMKTLSL